ncbi:hypothetical protein J2S97_002764 [Arthrobacter oryzae]|jgi:hypothetical protein|nr:hypothetical protein [Arthrobacter oryzae]
MITLTSGWKMTITASPASVAESRPNHGLTGS